VSPFPASLVATTSILSNLKHCQALTSRGYAQARMTFLHHHSPVSIKVGLCCLVMQCRPRHGDFHERSSTELMGASNEILQKWAAYVNLERHKGDLCASSPRCENLEIADLAAVNRRDAFQILPARYSWRRCRGTGRQQPSPQSSADRAPTASTQST
jgi:hypothetical protein